MPFQTFLRALALVAIFAASPHALAQAPAAGSTQPVDLTGRFNYPLSVTTNYNFLAWKTIPAGHHVFHGIPFEINGEIRLWGAGRSTNNFSPNPERAADITVNRQFETLYVYHCAHFKMPEGTPVCQVVFRYDNGSSATNSLRYGSDMIDWMVSGNEQPLRTPSANNSTLAWVGGQFSDTQSNQLRFCMTALPNPHPDQSVSTIDLISCKTKVVPIIMAMTTGPSGQMK